MLRLSWFDSYETRQAEQNLGVVCGGHGGLWPRQQWLYKASGADWLTTIMLAWLGGSRFGQGLSNDRNWLWSDSQIWSDCPHDGSKKNWHWHPFTQHTNTWSEGSWTSRHRSCLSVLCQWRLSHWCKYHRLSHSLKLSGMNLTQHMNITIKASKT